MKNNKRLTFIGVLLICCFQLLLNTAWSQSEGYWKGTTNQNNGVRFTVSGSEVSFFRISINSLPCNLTTSTVYNLPISADSFGYTSPSLDLTGTFTNATEITGTWDFHETTFSCYEDGTWTASLTADPYISLSPMGHDFGSVEIHTTTDDVPFILKNEGLGTATGSITVSGTHPDQFEIVSGDGSFSLAHGQSKVIYLKFAPTGIGTQSASLLVSGDSPCNSVSTSLSGSGFQVSPDSEWKITAADGALDDNFALSIDINNDVALAGSVFNDTNGSNSGAAYIFGRMSGGWEQLAKLTASDGAANDVFGRVAISGDYAVVAATGDDDRGSNSGSAYIFEKPSGGWIDMGPTTKLTASDGAASDYFGLSVDISGDYILVSAHQDDDAGHGSGSAYIFERIGSTWGQQAKLTASDAASNDYFGYSLSISGNYAIVGSYGDDNTGSDSGSAYIFERTTSGWVQQAKLTASDASYGDKFGYSVSISGNQVIVGAYNDDDNGNNSGSAYIFERIGSTWVQQAKLTASDGSTYDYFGYAVAVSETQAVVGAYLDDDSGSSSGSAYLFKKPVTGWVSMSETAKIVTSDGASEDYFGYSVSITNDYFIASAHQDDDQGYNSGSAYIYYLGNQLPTISDIDDQVVNQNTSSNAIEFTISDPETQPEDLIVTAESSDHLLVPPENIIFAGTETNRTVTLTPAIGQTGEASITISLSDTIDTVSISFLITVTVAQGDINSDGTIDLEDAITGLKILTGYLADEISNEGDVNNDNKIGVEEVIFVLNAIPNEN